jgi:hypothetical protein
VDMSNEINENLSNERLEKSRDEVCKSQTRHRNSGVETAVSLDRSELREDSGNCAKFRPHKFLGSTSKFLSFTAL